MQLIFLLGENIWPNAKVSFSIFFKFFLKLINVACKMSRIFFYRREINRILLYNSQCWIKGVWSTLNMSREQSPLPSGYWTLNPSSNKYSLLSNKLYWTLNPIRINGALGNTITLIILPCLNLKTFTIVFWFHATFFLNIRAFWFCK